MSKRLMLLISALLLVTVLVAACSSNDEAIERSVQQTVEAQRAIDVAVRQTLEAERADVETVQPASTTTPIGTASAVPSATPQMNLQVENTSTTSPTLDALEGEADHHSTPPDDIRGIWFGSAELTDEGRPGVVSVDLTIRLYQDLVLVDDDLNYTYILYPVSVDGNAWLLKSTSEYYDASATMTIVDRSADTLSVELTIDRGGNNHYRALSLKKMADIEPVDVTDIRELLGGQWRPVPMAWFNQGDVIEFFNNKFVRYNENGSDRPRSEFSYEFEGPNKLRVTAGQFPQDEQAQIDVAMPDRDTLVLLMHFADPSIETFPVLLYRIQLPKAATDRPDDEVLYPFLVNEDSQRCGYIDRSGAIVVEPKLTDCRVFSEGLAATNFAGWGFIDNTGAFAIQPQTSYIPFVPFFSDGLVAVQDEFGMIGYLNKEGDIAIPFQYSFVSTFSEGYALVKRENDLQGTIIDEKGQAIFNVDAPHLSIGSAFRNGLLATHRGYVNTEGQLVIELDQATQYNSDFSEGMAAIYDSNETGCYYIDSKGQPVLHTDYSACGTFVEGLAGVYRKDDNQCGYIDKRGNLEIPVRFDRCGDFSEGRALVMVGQYSGYIDSQGNYVFGPAPLTEADGFQNGLAQIRIDGKTGYIDQNGTYVFKP